MQRGDGKTDERRTASVLIHRSLQARGMNVSQKIRELDSGPQHRRHEGAPKKHGPDFVVRSELRPRCDSWLTVSAVVA
jgi:hypothetical protein